MEIILFALVFSIINIFFLRLYKKIEKKNSTDKSVFCHAVRAELEMFNSPSQIESKRAKLNGKNSKF